MIALLTTYYVIHYIITIHILSCSQDREVNILLVEKGWLLYCLDRACTIVVEEESILLKKHGLIQSLKNYYIYPLKVKPCKHLFIGNIPSEFIGIRQPKLVLRAFLTTYSPWGILTRNMSWLSSWVFTMLKSSHSRQ